MELIDIDQKLVNLLGFKDFGEYQNFCAHFFLHSTINLLGMTIKWYYGFISLIICLLLIFINFNDLKPLLNKDRHAWLDLIARLLGSCLPFITLLWK